MEKSLIIVGGGVIGLSCAYEIAKKDPTIKIKVLDKGICGQKATTASLGVLMPYVPNIEKPTAILQRTSIDMYPEFAKELVEFSGIDIEFKMIEHLHVLHTEKQLEKAQKAVERSLQDNKLIDNKPAFELLSFEEAKKLEPNLAEAKFGCMHSRMTGNLSTTKLIQALKVACGKLNVEIFENCDVRDILIKDGKTYGVYTADGDRLADKVLIANGAYSNQFKHVVNNLGEILPQKGEALEIEIKEKYFNRLIKMAGFYILCKDDGKAFVGSTSSRKPDFSEDVKEKSINMLIKGVQRIIPLVSKDDIIRAWAGHRPHSYLGSPLLGKCDEVENLFIATGHGKIGICTAPFTAKIISELITNNNQVIDLTPFKVNKLKQPGSKE